MKFNNIMFNILDNYLLKTTEQHTKIHIVNVDLTNMHLRCRNA